MNESCSLFLVTLLLLAYNLDYCNAVCKDSSCPATNDKMINVHLVPHSHNDVGWVRTVDQYYIGNNVSSGVRTIIGKVMAELHRDPSRRFIQVEMVYFHKWFMNQTKKVQDVVKQMVQDGRLEFAGGGWSMNDEAAVHYQSIIDQFTIGLKFITNTFGYCSRPRIGWQIDPFGHSREMASIFAQMGYDGEFFGRIDFMEKNQRMNESTMEMIWQSSESLENSGIFSGLLYNLYNAPRGFCFDATCSRSEFLIDEDSETNVKFKVDAFINYIQQMKKSYRTTHVMLTMGGDFQYQHPILNYQNMDMLIKYVNERKMKGSNVHVFYSTPACYLNELHKQKNLTWPSKKQDFFPYASDSHSYWTGYFTSRPTQKRFERMGNHFLQTVKQLSILAKLTSSQHTEKLEHLREVMGIMQHHDAITGTEKQHVARDYNRMLTDAIEDAQSNSRDALRVLTNFTRGDFKSCLQLNISVCDYTSKNSDNVLVTLFNPLAHQSMQYVRIPIKQGAYAVSGYRGQTIASEVVPIPWQVLALKYRANTTQYELVFSVTIDKLANFHIRELPPPESFGVSNAFDDKPEMELIVQNSLIKLVFKNGYLRSITMNNVTENISQYFGIYKSASGDNGDARQRSSGAYIFRPDEEVAVPDNEMKYTFYNGTQVKEVHKTVNKWISQVIRIYEDVNRVEFEWLIGPIPVSDRKGKEIVTRFQSNIASNGVFYTDSNGREMIMRKRNQREHFEADLSESISGNYYPVTARIALQDQHKRLTLLNDRAQGGSSLRDGQLELMLHRRLLHDDGFGVDEALNEMQYGTGLVARGKIYLMLSGVSERATFAERIAQHEIHLPFWKFFSRGNFAKGMVTKQMPDFNILPPSVELLTLEPYSKNGILLRLEHILDHTDGSNVSFNILSIFNALNGQEICETTLDGNLPLSKMKRLKFRLDGSMHTTDDYYKPGYKPLEANTTHSLSKFDIQLKPMQIRTFLIKWK